MTGWRIGWVLGPRAAGRRLCRALLAQHPVPGDLRPGGRGRGPHRTPGAGRDLRAEYRRRRDFIHPFLAAIPGVTCVEPGGGFYFFPNVSRTWAGTCPRPSTWGPRLLDEKRVAVVPGEGFGAPGYLRISFARPMEELEGGGRRSRSSCPPNGALAGRRACPRPQPRAVGLAGHARRPLPPQPEREGLGLLLLSIPGGRDPRASTSRCSTTGCGRRLGRRPSSASPRSSTRCTAWSGWSGTRPSGRSRATPTASRARSGARARQVLGLGRSEARTGSRSPR